MAKNSSKNIKECSGLKPINMLSKNSVKRGTQSSVKNKK